MTTLSEAIRKSVPRVMRISSGGASEPTEQGSLRDALRIKEDIIGARMMEQTYEDLERDTELKRARSNAELAKARADELDATVKLEETKAKQSGNGSSGSANPLLVMLNSVVETMQGQNIALMQEAKEAREGALAQAITSLKEEMSNLKTQTLTQGATHTRADDVEGFLTRVEDVRKAIEMLKGFQPASAEVSGMQGDFQTIMMLRRMNDEMILRMEEIKDRRDQVSWDRDMQREQLNMEERRSQRMAKTIEQALPMVSGLVYEKTGITPPAAAAQATEAQCPTCKGALVMSVDGSTAFCPQCSQSYKVSGE
jgi:hypothetical protein